MARGEEGDALVLSFTPRALSKDKIELFPSEPGYCSFGLPKACTGEIGIVSPFLKLDLDVLFPDGDDSGGIDEVPEEVTRLGVLITIADLSTRQPTEAARHLHGYGR